MEQTSWHAIYDRYYYLIARNMEKWHNHLKNGATLNSKHSNTDEK